MSGVSSAGEWSAAAMTSPAATVQSDVKVLFVCLGNICRSPCAEGVFRHRVERAGLGARIHVDSAGTGDWHVGRPPDTRAIAAARARGYDLTPLRARQVRRSDFAHFGWILAMDRSNLTALKALRPPDYAGHLGLFLELAPDLGTAEVPDPYYGGHLDFVRMLELIERASDTLLARVCEDLARGAGGARR
jgi:protein-tyrosine phosphatase